VQQTTGFVVATAISCILLGIVIGGFLFGSPGTLEIKPEVPVVDLLQFIVSVIALVWVPSVVARLERRGAFDRRAVSRHLEPAYNKLLEMDAMLKTVPNPMPSQGLLDMHRMIRTHLDHAQQIARLWRWPKRVTHRLDDAVSFARKLYRATTDSDASTRLPEAQAWLSDLNAALLDLLRSSA
jgi:hypothetical protein